MNLLIRKYIYVNYLVQGMTMVINFLYSLIIVRQLGANGYGEYAIFYNSLTFAVLLLGFNFPSILAFFIANKKIDPFRLLFASCLALLFTTALVGFVLGFSDSAGFSSHIFPGGNNKSLWIFFFTAVYFLLQANQLAGSYLNGHKIFIPIAVFSLLANAALLIFWILLMSKVFSVTITTFDLIWWLTILVNFLILVYAVFLIYSRTGVLSISKLINRAELRMIARFTLIVYCCNTIQFLNYRMDLWFVNYYAGESETGIYALALSLSQLIWIFPNAISGVILHYFQENQRQDSIRLATHYARITIYFSLFCALALALIFYFALPAFYGPQFLATYRICLLLFAGTIPFSLSILIANLNSGIGFVRVNLYGTIFIFILGFILDMLLIPTYGIMGAAVAKVIIYITSVAFHLIVGHVLYKLRWLSLLKFPSLTGRQ